MCEFVSECLCECVSLVYVCMCMCVLASVCVKYKWSGTCGKVSMEPLTIYVCIMCVRRGELVAC